MSVIEGRVCGLYWTASSSECRLVSAPDPLVAAERRVEFDNPECVGYALTEKSEDCTCTADGKPTGEFRFKFRILYLGDSIEAEIRVSPVRALCGSPMPAKTKKVVDVAV